MRWLGDGRLEPRVPEGSVRTVLHLLLLHPLLEAADRDGPADLLEVRLEVRVLDDFPWLNLHRQIAKDPFVGRRWPLVGY